MPSTGAKRLEHRRRARELRRDRDIAERAECDRLRELVPELERRVEHLEGQGVYREVVLAKVDRDIAQRRAESLDAENARLWAEIERLSPLTFPMRFYRPADCDGGASSLTVDTAAGLAQWLRTGAPVVSWERSPFVAARSGRDRKGNP